MPYPTRLLLEGETVAVDLRPHWWYFAKPGAAGVPVLALVVAAGRLEGDAETAALFGVGVLALVWAASLVTRLARWATTHFVVTSERIIYRTGVLSKHSLDIPLERVNDIASSRTLFERIIGAGDLRIESAGERGQQIFSDIARPDHVQHEIYRQMEANAARGPGVPAGGGGEASVPAQIAALADLADRGVISRAEFEAKKSELLSRM